jgi:hypothetical protein
MASSAQRVIRDPRFARGAATPSRAAAQPRPSPALPNDTQLLLEAIDTFESLLRIGTHRATPNASTREQAQALQDDLARSLTALGQARAWLNGQGADALLRGEAGAETLDLARRALACHLEPLQASAEMQLACEFGDVVLGQSDASLDALARRMDPRFAAAHDLSARLARAAAATAS